MILIYFIIKNKKFSIIIKNKNQNSIILILKKIKIFFIN
jgi:hypothetical protein